MEKASETTKESKAKKSVLRHGWLWALIGLVAGMLVFIVYRAVVAKNPYTHYHANFAVYINGQQQKFEGPGYYEEVAACNVHNADDLKSRAHMHDNVNHVVHVHDAGVSWSDFFNNIGYTLGDSVLSDGTHAYISGQDGNSLTFMLNGKKVSSIATSVIKSEDILLINYGNDDAAAIQQHFDAIPRDAHHYNITKDPSACSGGQNFGWSARFKEALGVGTTSH